MYNMHKRLHNRQLLITEQEKIPARNAMDTHAQLVMANNKFLQYIPKAFVPRLLDIQVTVHFNML